MNRVILLGRLVRDTELRYTQAAEPLAVCRFSVAVNRQHKRDNEQASDFINCIAFGKRGETVNQYFCKGSRIGVEGKLQISQYKDKEGNNRYSTDVIVENIEFINTKAENEARGVSAQQTSTQGFSIDNDAEDEDLPF